MSAKAWEVLSQNVLSKDWSFYNDSSHHWIGLDLVKNTGCLSRPMNMDNPCPLWAWIGIGFDGDLVAAIELGGDEKYFTSHKVRQKLKDFKLKEQDHDPSLAKGQRKYWGYTVLKGYTDLNHVMAGNANVANEILSILETKVSS